jgi:CheY-like chemotaxis protein
MKRNLILVVDDHRDARRMLVDALKMLGSDNEVVDVPSGEEALLVNSRQPVDLLILDVNLPGISGLEVVEKVQRRNPGLKIILITGSTDSGIRKRVDEAAVEGVFYKPISINPFLETVNRCLGLAGGEAEAAVLPEERLETGIQPEKPTVEDAVPPAQNAASSKIEGLLKEVNARVIAVVNHTGERILQAGELSLISEDLGAAALSLLQASVKAGKALKDERPEIITCMIGHTYMLYLAPITDENFLVVIAEFVSHDRSSQQGVKVLNFIPEIRAELSRASEPEIQEPQAESQPLAEIVIPDEAIDPDELAAMEAFFSQAETKPSKVKDIDEFWESLAEQNGESTTSQKGMLSYDQAREMGIAPE